MNPPPDSIAAARPFWSRLLRSLVAIAFTLVLVLLTALFVVGCIPAVQAAFSQMFSFAGEVPKLAVTLTALVVAVGPVVLMLVAEHKRWLTWPALAAGWLVVLPLLGWLAWDDTALRHPVSIEEFAPSFAGAEQSYAVLMQYSKQTPSEEAKAFDRLNLATNWNGGGTSDPAKWIEFVTRNRASIEADWAALAPQRRWLAELNAFDRYGDLTPAGYTSNIISFKVWRSLSQRTCAIATLQALDGHGDEAMHTLLPMLEAGRKLQPSSRTLVRSMIGVVIEKMCLETATLLLDRATVSAAGRQRLLAGISGDNAAAMARRLALVDFMQMAPMISSMKLGDHLTYDGERMVLFRRPLNFLSALLFNPTASRNMLSDHFYEIAALAEARELGKLQVRSGDFVHAHLDRPGIKNLGGRLLAVTVIPAYHKVTESYWKTADLREALVRKLTAAPAG